MNNSFESSRLDALAALAEIYSSKNRLFPPNVGQINAVPAHARSCTQFLDIKGECEMCIDVCTLSQGFSSMIFARPRQDSWLVD